MINWNRLFDLSEYNSKGQSEIMTHVTEDGIMFEFGELDFESGDDRRFAEKFCGFGRYPVPPLIRDKFESLEKSRSELLCKLKS